MKNRKMMKKVVAVSMTAAMLLSAGSTFVSAADAKWTETETPDGWIQVVNEGGATLGYMADTGVTILEEDGYAFKDLNKNGTLDVYEDWREDAETRAEDLAPQLGKEDIAGLMVQNSVIQLADDGSDAFFTQGTFSEALAQGVRNVLNFGVTYPPATQAKWNNNMQKLAEESEFGIPVNITTNPRTFSGYPENLALAATFDTELVGTIAEQQAKMYRSVGVTTLLGPQIDVASEPRWSRFESTFGEDPALSRDLTEAYIDKLQSTYAEDGTDLGWGEDSVLAMMKHFPGDGPAESGRESHDQYGKYTVYPGDGFETSLIPFVDGGLNLEGETGESASVMTSYSAAYSDTEEYGEIVGSAFSEYKISLLRDDYNYDGVICSDWDVTGAEGAFGYTAWGVEDLTREERVYKAIEAGIDEFGHTTADEHVAVAAAYDTMIEEEGEEATRERFEASARRILKTFFEIGLFDNPYVSTENAQAQLGSEEYAATAAEAQLKSVIMLKNDGAIQAASDEKPTVYIPMVYTPAQVSMFGSAPASWDLPVDKKTADSYFNVITDTVGDPTGTDAEGNPSLTEDDIIRASADELAECTMAIVIVTNPQTGDGHDEESDTYIPVSLQYGEYTADSDGVRDESLAGDTVKTEQATPYGNVTNVEKENRSYYGESTVATNLTDLAGIQYAAENMPESGKVVVAVKASNPVVFSEFESDVDAILLGFTGVDNETFLNIAAGQTEPSGLLPCQMPADMETVESQYEDVPRDMECYVDADGNSYDFAYGLNWSGVISDERTATYAVDPILEPAA